jgi:Protein of unknown function (DUF1592)/Protein of unknown function (DUF1588)/Protein of unknown function (DUF1587)/Protein of unknown function (DUF1595)/Protein of unknown function (DUF1585)/Ca-dependent carbohydrate-binding module xylan-binding/Planctomycete cytochrome C
MRRFNLASKFLATILSGWITLSGCLADEVVATQPELESIYQQEILPIFEKHCYDCHGDGSKKGELSLDPFGDIPSMIANREVWNNIRNHISFRLMPPPDEVSPSPAEREKLLNWIDHAIFSVDPNNPDPGSVTLRRLNRVEYQNTIRDLLGVTVNVAEILPQDDTGYGFDNIGDVLTLSPVHLERYLKAAKAALSTVTYPGPMTIPLTSINGVNLKGDGSISDEGHFLAGNGQAFSEFRFPRSGRYRIEVTASSDWPTDERPKCDIVVDGHVLATWDVEKLGKKTKIITPEISCKNEASLRVAAFFTNDLWQPKHEDSKQRDRNLFIHQITVEGPLDGPLPDKPITHRQIYGERLVGQSDADYMKEVLTRFAKKAFRRPVTAEEIERYLVFMKNAQQLGEGVEHAIQYALEAMLVSPAFLFREESVIVEKKTGRKLVSEHALASRLSYFLWSTMPDDSLFARANAGELRKNLAAEVGRMVASDRSSALVKNFAGQWLQLRDVEGLYRDTDDFPNFNSRLTKNMRTETEMLISHVIKDNLPVSNLLDADYTFINQRLAAHYGIPNVQGDMFRRVSLIGTPRRGILNHGSFLSLSSYPNRTSPVLRGKYILENILDTPPPPPPPNIPQLTGADGHGEETSLRQQMEKHRDDPECSSCHALMDPIGFGLENYDATGAWRDRENGRTISAAGTLVTGQSFTTAEQLRDTIARDHRAEFHRALASKLLTYALGRGLDWYDRPTVDQIVLKAGGDEIRFTSLVQAIVDSVAFQYRR